MLDPTPLQTGQSYATVADIRDCEDLPQMPISPGFKRHDGSVEPFWTNPDGSPMIVLVRGLSFKERREINAATKDDDDQLVLETCLRGLVAPAFTREQLAIFDAKHPDALDQVSDTIWSLSNLPAAMVRRMVREKAGLPPEPPLAAPRS